VYPPTFSGENLEIVARWERHLGLQQLKQSTISLKLWSLYSLLKYYNFKLADILTKAEIEDYILHRRETRKPRTVHNDIIELRMFFKWLSPGNDYFEGIRSKPPKNDLPVEQLVTPTDVTCLVDACQGQRDRAIIMLLWDSAVRLQEGLDLNVGSFVFDNNGAVVIVNGKTGMRRIRLIDGVPDIQNWINMHPYRDDHEAPLFVTTRLYDGKHKRLDKRTVQNMMKTVSKRSGIQKNIHPHALRHARLTNLAKQGFSEMELRIIAGWEKNSDMPAVYIHLSGADVENKILEKNGLIEPNEEIKTPPTKPKECPRCKTKNAYDAQYCMTCSMIIDLKKAKEFDEKINHDNEKPSEIDEMKKQIQGLTKLVTEFSSTIHVQAKSKEEIENRLMEELLRGGNLQEDSADIVIDDKTDMKEIQKMVEMLKAKQGLAV